MSVTGFNRRRRKLAEEARKAKEAEECEGGACRVPSSEESEPEVSELAFLEEERVEELRARAEREGIEGLASMRKAELVEALKAVM